MPKAEPDDLDAGPIVVMRRLSETRAQLETGILRCRPEIPAWVQREHSDSWTAVVRPLRFGAARQLLEVRVGK